MSIQYQYHSPTFEEKVANSPDRSSLTLSSQRMSTPLPDDDYPREGLLRRLKESPKTAHFSHRRKEGRLRVFLSANIFLVLHLMVAVAIACVLLFYIDKRQLNIQSRRENVTEADATVRLAPFNLLQSDVITAISSAQVIVRWLASSWTALAVWQSVFILLESSGLTLAELELMLTYKMPATLRGSKNHGWRVPVLVVFTLLLIQPMQIAAPILTGSITWIPTTGLVPGIQMLNNISRGGDSFTWQVYQDHWDDRRTAVQQAAGLAVVAWANLKVPFAPETLGDIVTALSVPSASVLLPNTTVTLDMTMPLFSLESFAWVTDDKTALPLWDKIQDQAGLLNVSDWKSPLTAPVPGNAALIFNTSWTPAPRQNEPDAQEWRAYDYYPPSLIKSAAFHLAIVTGHNDAVGVNCSRQSSRFGPLPNSVSVIATTQTNTSSNVQLGQPACYAFAEVTITAGVTRCSQCRVREGGIVVGGVTEAHADSMTEEALRLTPEVTQLLVALNQTLPPAWMNVEQYIATLLTRSYGAAWNMLMLRTEATQYSVSVSLPVAQSIALVDKNRVYVWLGLQGLVTLAGLLLILAQRRSKRYVVLNGPISALLLDTQGVFDRDDGGLCNFSKLCAQDSRRIGSLYLAHDTEGHFALTTDRP